MDDANPLVGAWRLTSWELREADGSVRPQYGPDVVGYLLYTADGYMSAQIMNPDRQQSRPHHPVEPPLAQTLDAADRVRAYDTYLSYCGPYTIEGDTVTHHVSVGLIPAWVGTDQVRHFTLQDGRLVITSGGYTLTWERATGPG